VRAASASGLRPSPPASRPLVPAAAAAPVAAARAASPPAASARAKLTDMAAASERSREPWVFRGGTASGEGDTMNHPCWTCGASIKQHVSVSLRASNLSSERRRASGRHRRRSSRAWGSLLRRAAAVPAARAAAARRTAGALGAARSTQPARSRSVCVCVCVCVCMSVCVLRRRMHSPPQPSGRERRQAASARWQAACVQRGRRMQRVAARQQQGYAQFRSARRFECARMVITCLPSDIVARLYSSACRER
jgi:hypothetical protein